MTDLTAVVDAACAAAPELDRRVIEDIVAAAAPITQQRNKLIRYLADVTAFTSGASDVPPVVARVLTDMAGAGAPVTPPACDGCGRVVRLVYKRGSGRVCKACGQSQYSETCSECGQDRRVSIRNPDGTAVCNSCRLRQRTEHCASCGRDRPVSRRTPDGGALCQSCYQRPERECASCGRVAPVKSNKTGEPLCGTCYRAPAALCAKCGEHRALAARDVIDLGNVCTRCWRPATRTCSVCGDTKPCRVSESDGKPYCGVCAPRPLVTCARCGRDRPVQAHTDIGPVCNGCYDHVVARPCAACGELTRIYADGRCHRCVLTARLDTAFGQRPELTSVRDALLEGRSAAATLRWFDHGAGGQLLRRVASGEVELSHEALDQFGRGHRHVDHVRQLLVAVGALPDRGELAARLSVWLDSFTATLPPSHARVVRPFAEWRILRRVRRQDARDRLTDAGAKWARQRIRTAANLLAWLDLRDLELESLAQRDLDAWLAAGPTTRYCIRDFLRWAHERNEAPKLTVPLRQALTATAAVDDADRWALVDDLLHNEDIPLDLRIAGLLVLVYGQHLSRVATIRLDDIEHGPPTTVKFGSSPVALLEPLDDLVRRQVETPRGHAGAAVENPWLFPGGHAGENVTPEQLRKRLEAAIGIRARPSRNTALLHLAREIPVPVLADLLGLHFNTAVDWVQLARGDWSGYVASREASARRAPAASRPSSAGPPFGS
ncbi:hypothetical protein [Actinomarinicola tropica]|uniref:Uncharacterized protein n=1 Tax=Actinomarinicola tropica TaxID=2789776 RepID=A0A5Q2RK47_9ACTN|nr:hypothetical protein [Actinomarinicola tropica]QGG94941.1 hypothetical protein GH723_07365 [Actinomarinicola tropica]